MKRDITIVLKVRNAAKVKKEIQGVFNNNATKKVKEYENRIKGLEKKYTKLSKRARSTGKSIGGFTSRLVGAIASIAIYNRAFTKTIELFERSATLERAGNAFKNVVGSLSSVMPVLRASTRDTVEDLTLMKTATRAVTEGLQKGQLAKVFQMATVASRQLNLTTSETIQTITKAITRHDESALTSLGIIMKNNQAYQTQLKIIRQIPGPVNAAIKIQMRHALIMSQLKNTYGGFNQLQMDSLEVLNRARTAWANLSRTFGGIVQIAFRPLIVLFTEGSMALNRMIEMFVMADGPTKELATNIILLGSAYASLAASMKLVKLMSIIGLAPFFKIVAIVALVGAGLTAAGVKLSDFVDGFRIAGKAMSVFLQLISNYKDINGMSSVLAEDAEAIGGLYPIILQLARAFKVVQAVGTGVAKGIANVFKALAPILGVAGNDVAKIFQAFADGGPIAQSTLNRIENSIISISSYVIRMIELFIKAKELFGGISTFAMPSFGSSLGKTAGQNVAKMMSSDKSAFDTDKQTELGLHNLAPTETELSSVSMYKILQSMDSKLETKNSEDVRRENKRDSERTEDKSIVSSGTGSF